MKNLKLLNKLFYEIKNRNQNNTYTYKNPVIKFKCNY